jgi:hypothetical protein
MADCSAWQGVLGRGTGYTRSAKNVSKRSKKIQAQTGLEGGKLIGIDRYGIVLEEVVDAT